MDRSAIARACDEDESWLDGWDGGPIGIYPAGLFESGTFERVGTRARPTTWVLDIGVRRRSITSLGASRIRYALDRLCVAHLGRPPVKKGA